MSTDQQRGSKEWCKTALGKTHLNGADPSYLQGHMRGVQRATSVSCSDRGWALCYAGLCISTEVVQLTPNLKSLLHKWLPKQEVSSATEAALSLLSTPPGHFASSFTTQLYQRYGDISHSSRPALLVPLPSSDFPEAGVLEGCKQRMAPLHYSKIPKSCCTSLDLQMPSTQTAWLKWAKCSHLRHHLCFHSITCSLLLGSIKPGANKNLYLKLKNFP